MKKILGLILCMGIFLVGQALVYGSPPGNEKQFYETTARSADSSVIEMNYADSSPLTIEMLRDASDMAARQATAETATELSRVTDLSDISRTITELQLNAVDRRIVSRLMARMSSRKTAHRQCACSENYTPPNSTGRTLWMRKTCEG